MLKKTAKEITGGLTTTSKLGCYSYSIPAAECKTGGKLRKVAGSTCADCYACKGFYKLYEKTVLPAQYNRLNALQDPLWVEAMATLIKGQSFFRWHDSGDIQNLGHLIKLISVAESCPDTLFWLPTKESKIVSDYLKCADLPPNLVVRLSAAMIDKPAKDIGLCTATVHKDKPPIGFECAAIKGKCGDCRACWDKSVLNISYKKH